MIGFKGIERKISRTLFTAQSLVSAALITTGTVNSISGAELSGKTAWAGFPATVFLVSAAFGALGWGILMERFGRRTGLTLGLIAGGSGGALSILAFGKGSFLVFLFGMALLGLGQSAMMLGRFAAAEIHPVDMRGKAIANVVLGGTVGSIVGPLLVAPAGRVAERMGLNELAGPYGSGLVLFLIGAAVVYIWLRPEPMDIAKKIILRGDPPEKEVQTKRSILIILRRPRVISAVLTMVVSQAVMVMIMVITSLHMKELTHPLSSISLVISAHTFGMYAFSVFSGRLVDKIGRMRVIMIGSMILVLSGIGAGLSPDVLPIALTLFLLGLGWNFCFIGGSTLLTDQLAPEEQSRTQGMNDLFVGLASAIGSLGSGFIFSAVGFQLMGFIGAGLAVIPFLSALWWWKKRP